MYYISGNKVYVKDGNAYRQVAITAKDKVVETRELESVTVTPSDTTVKKLSGATAATLDEVIKRFHISEDNPVKVASSKKASGAKTV